MNKQPERTAMTRQDFINAFLELSNYKSIDKITVAELAKKAGGKISAWKKDEDPLVSGHVLATNGKIHDHLQNILIGGDLSVLDNVKSL